MTFLIKKFQTSDYVVFPSLARYSQYEVVTCCNSCIICSKAALASFGCYMAFLSNLTSGWPPSGPTWSLILASATGFIELLPSLKQPVKLGEGRCLWLASYFKTFTKKIYPGHCIAMHLQCTTKFSRYQSQSGKLCVRYHNRFILYFPPKIRIWRA